MGSESESLGNFHRNLGTPLHGWYPYIEGFSSDLVAGEIARYGDSHPRSAPVVYDPFAGTGTTPLTASQMGLDSCYSETNPYMRFVVDTKVNRVRELLGGGRGVRLLEEAARAVSSMDFPGDSGPESWGGFEKYYDRDVLSRIVGIRDLVNGTLPEPERSIAMLALSSILVPVSNMTRRGDLRFATRRELGSKDKDVTGVYVRRLRGYIDDIESFGHTVRRATRGLSDDCRDLPDDVRCDLVVTSPPYMNGTNYVRNTKLELKLTGFVSDESDVGRLHSIGITAGINGVRRNSDDVRVPDQVRSYYDELLEVAYDRRIPRLVAGYFGDMESALTSIRRSLRDGGTLVMDIGDSQYAGVHIPTHGILREIAETRGLSLASEEVIRTRRSRNGSELTQVLQRYRAG